MFLLIELETNNKIDSNEIIFLKLCLKSVQLDVKLRVGFKPQEACIAEQRISFL